MHDTDEMGYAEFVETGTALANAIMNRIPERWREAVAVQIEDGIQWPAIFMEDLVTLLERDQVPITPAERDTVVRLMRHRKADLTPVERFNVIGTPLLPEFDTDQSGVRPEALDPERLERSKQSDQRPGREN
ncbi:MAG: hypothetical protein ACRDT4_20010 [Micromonosporaceae bacterium]